MPPRRAIPTPKLAKRVAKEGDPLTTMRFAEVDSSEADGWRPRVAVLSEQNDRVRILMAHTSQVNA